MSFYRVVPISEDLASEVRSTLKKFREGEEDRILFTYDAFTGVDGYPSPGPVFIHREDCAAYEDEGFPPELRDLPLTLEAYGPDRWIMARERVENGEVDAAIERLFGQEGVGYIHVRNTQAGCYIARVER